jgi:hypothetical protein
LVSLFHNCFQRDKCPGQKETEEKIRLSRMEGGLIYKRPRYNIKKKKSVVHAC